MMNPAALFKIKGAWDTFARNHPKFPMFVQAVSQAGITEGTIIEVSVTSTDGRKMETNVKLTASDLELFEMLKKMN